MAKMTTWSTPVWLMLFTLLIVFISPLPAGAARGMGRLYAEREFAEGAEIKSLAQNYAFDPSAAVLARV